jgi:biotin-(acetyl-CoA carboxylase) ligase
VLIPFTSIEPSDRMRSSLVVFVALVCFGLIAAAATVAGAETKNPDREKVVAQLKNIVKNWKTKNIEGILASYADDAREFYAAVQVDGKSNIRKMYESS